MHINVYSAYWEKKIGNCEILDILYRNTSSQLQVDVIAIRGICNL